MAVIALKKYPAVLFSNHPSLLHYPENTLWWPLKTDPKSVSLPCSIMRSYKFLGMLAVHSCQDDTPFSPKSENNVTESVVTPKNRLDSYRRMWYSIDPSAGQCIQTKAANMLLSFLFSSLLLSCFYATTCLQVQRERGFVILKSVSIVKVCQPAFDLKIPIVVL